MTTAPDDAVAVTLASYDAAADRYRASAGAQTAAWRAFFDDFTARIAGGHVLEVGSGPGREALLLEQRGLTVTRSDGATAFVAMMTAAGHDARQLDVRTDALGGPYDGILANAVLLHLDRSDLLPVLRRLRAAVHDHGVLALTLKEGEGEEWHRRKLAVPRRFTYWRAPALRDALQAAGWRVLSCEQVAGAREPVEPWLYVLAAAA